MDLKGFLREAALRLADCLEMEAEELEKLFYDREQESSTVLREGVAIPHIVVPGEGKFDILLARCKKGVQFSKENPDIRTIFLLAGTRDERNFHLRALAAIAQLVQHARFERKWMQARSVDELRDMILLGRRTRYPVTPVKPHHPDVSD
jgi:mannitol/fructose-specific phosphotransferase system IIA component (Ntr-type)